MISGVSFCKTRLAPTPSGYLHAGNALNFLLASALAKCCGARVLLRIDDLDRERYRPAYANDVFETLRFLTINWEEGPQNMKEFEQAWSQQYRRELYNDALQKLKEKKAVFACNCSRTQSTACNCRDKALPLDAPNSSWRLITNDDPVVVQTIDGGTVVSCLPVKMKNFTVRKKDGLPAYQLSSLVDDLHFDIDLIVRGQDLWPSTLAQVFLATCLGEEKFSSIRFYHHPLLTTDSGEKLSKSAGASSVKHWREGGAPLEDFFAYIGSLLYPSLAIKNTADVLKLLDGQASFHSSQSHP